MINDYYIVAINLVVNDKLANKDNYPILCYCKSTDDITDIIKSNKDFKNLVYEKCYKTYSLASSTISLIYYKEINEEDTYETKTYKVTEIFDIDYNEYIKLSGLPKISTIFKDLYIKSFKEPLVTSSSTPEEVISDIQKIYVSLKEKYQDRITKTTIINYVRKELLQQNINKDDINKIIDLVEKILTNFN